MKFAITSLFRALSQHLNNRPLILYIDDLQWADKPGLELLQTLISDESLQYLFFIGSYRSNEIDDNPHFQTMIQNFKDKVPYETMQIAEISSEATGEFIADSLGLSVDDVEPLTKVVFSKTLGNPLYTRQALEHLVRKNALYYDNMIFSWNWNLGSTRDMSASETTKYLEDLLADDISSMLKSKIENLSSDGIRQTLAAASVVRASFDSDTMLSVMVSLNDDSSSLRLEAPSESIIDISDITLHAENKRRLTESLEQAVEEGLLLCKSDRQDVNQTYVFAHDQIQDAALSFVDDDGEERGTFFIKVGLGLLLHAESLEDDEDWMFFAAARNLNSVSTSHVLFDKDLKRKVVELNIHTAQISLNLLAFHNAIEFVEKGLSLLSDLTADMWETDYQLAMDLHNIGAQAEQGAEHMDKAEAYCKQVLKRKKDTLSALPAYKVHLDVLAGEPDSNVALQMSLRVLEEIGGVKFPKSERARKIKAWATLQQMKAGGLPTEEKIAKMSRASDPIAVATMELLQKAVRFAYAVKPYMYMLLCCEAIKWMNKYGLTDSSAAATSSFANVITHKFDDFKTGARLARLAIFIVDKQKNKFYETQPINTANNNVLGWVTPIKTRMPFHVRAYQSGVASGNLEGACVGKWNQCEILYHTASPLSLLEIELQSMKKKSEKWGYDFFRHFYAILLQLVFNLVGKSENTVKIIGSSADETDPIWQQMPHKAVLEAFQSQTMVFFGDFENGAEDALRRGDSYNHQIMGNQYGLEPFYRGISLYAMWRKTGDKKFKKAAREVRKQYQTWVKKGCVNLKGLLKLFDAEELTMAKKQRDACKKYEDSIRVLLAAGFYSNGGVACERYSAYLGEIGQAAKSKSQLEQAKAHYNRWGAKKKAEILTDQLAKLP
ncbi:MAG: hypothetical protein SGILL_006779 [Bacillariaceae sp.]